LDVLVIDTDRLLLLMVLVSGVGNEALSEDPAYTETAGAPQFKIKIYNTITTSENKSRVLELKYLLLQYSAMSFIITYNIWNGIIYTRVIKIWEGS
jgi:hypothetical protein